MKIPLADTNVSRKTKSGVGKRFRKRKINNFTFSSEHGSTERHVRENNE